MLRFVSGIANSVSISFCFHIFTLKEAATDSGQRHVRIVNHVFAAVNLVHFLQ